MTRRIVWVALSLALTTPLLAQVTAPTNSTPANGAIVATATPTLTWTASTSVNGILNYDVQVASDAAFTFVQYSATVVPLTVTTTALVDGLHYWHVRGRDNLGNLSAYSATFTLTTDTVPPTVPVLSTPANAGFVATATPTLTWAASTDATSGVQNYDVQVANNPGFSPTEFTATVVPTNVTTGALALGLHYWRVLARDNAGNVSAFSGAFTFTVDTTAPGLPTLSTPANAGYVATTTPTLTWLAAADDFGIQNYDVQVANNPGFAPTEYTTTTTALSTTTTALPLGLQYWRVQARDNAGNLSGFTAAFTFTVDTTAPTVPVLSTPASGAIVGTATPTLTWAASTDDFGVQNYDVQVASDAAFTAIQYSSTVVPTSVTTTALVDGLHYWHVRARDNAGNLSAYSAAFTLTTDTDIPSVPVLSTPVNAAYVATATPTLTWAASTDATSGIQNYDVQVANNPGFSPTEFTTTVVPTNVTTPALALGLHYWRVLARDNAGLTSAFSAAFTFTVDTTAPGLPTLSTPANAGYVATTTPTLTWLAAADDFGIQNYDVQVANNVGFAPTEYTTTTAALNVTTPALPLGVQYWRVQARDNAGNVSGFTAAFTFTVDNTPPTVPVLSTPASGALLATATPTLTWAASTDDFGVQNYDVQVASDAAFSVIQYSSTVVPTSVTTAALPDGLHYWRVRARDNAGNVSAFSGAFTLTTDTTPPTVPVLSTPASGGFVNTTTPTLTWLASTDATTGVQNYDLQVASDAAFTLIQFTLTTSATAGVTTALPDGVHYWRVRARDNVGNMSAYSAAFTLTTDTTAPTVPALSTPANGALLATTTPTLTWVAATDDNGIQNYDVQVASDAAFTAIQYSTTVVPATVTTAALPDGLHYWRVRSRDVAGNVSAYSAAFTLTTDVTPPTVPALSTPLNGAIVATTTPTLTWVASTDATSGVQNYDVQVASDAAFTAIQYSTTVVPTTATTAALPDGLHYWHVRARDNAGNVSAYSGAFTVTTDTAPPTVPALSTPANGAILATTTPTLTWVASTDATSGVQNYDVQVASDVAFTAIQYSTTVVPTTVTTAALPDGLHYWHVRARDNAGNVSAYSGAFTVTTDTVPPTVPALSTPANGALLGTATPTLTWAASTDATSGVRNYDVQVASDAGFVSVQFSSTVVATTVTTAALPDGVHYWHVRARDNAGNVSAYSGTSSFSTDTTPPTVPVLSTPASGSNSGTATPTLTWGASTDDNAIQNYDVQVASDAAFTALQFSATVVPTSAVTTALPDGLHYWHVRARDNVGLVSAYSAAFTFTTDTLPPTLPVLSTPADGSTVPTATPTLTWTAGSDATGIQNYDVEVASDAAFTAIQFSATVVPTSVTTAALPDGVHYWHVRARDNAGVLSNFTAAFSFTSDQTPPTVPVLSTPADTSTVVTPRPTLTWMASTDDGAVQNYDVQVASDAAFTTVVYSATVVPTSATTTSLSDGVYYWHVLARDNAGLVSAYSGAFSFTVDTTKGFYVGLGVGGNGQIAPFQKGSTGYAARPLFQLPWYANGETRPAAGNFHGDGRTELAIGFGKYPGANGGWVGVFTDTGAGFTLQKWVQVPWTAYNAANGETYPACGDVDGDGTDEIVVGLGTYTANGGYFAIFNDASTNYAFRSWGHVTWSLYNAADGQTRPAVGDTDGDGASEVLIGFGPYPSQGGRMQLFSDRTQTPGAFIQETWTQYNAADGETWPALGDVDGDGKADVCVGLGPYPPNGWVEYLKDASGGFGVLAWKQLPWSQYNAASGETRPSVGHLTGLTTGQTVIGLGKNVGALGYVAIYDRAPGFSLLGWRQVSFGAYDSSNGETRPSVGR